MEILQNRIDDNLLLKKKLINNYKESKQNINFKTQIAYALLKSIKEDNEKFYTKSNNK